MKVIVKPINDNVWAGVINYRNCHTDLCPFIQPNGSRYTGLDKKTEEKLAEELNTDLKPSSEYWDTFFIRMTDEEIVLNTEDPYDLLKYMFLKGHMKVKSSPSEMKAGAKFVMINEDDEAKKFNIKAKTKRDAYIELGKMTPQDMRDALRLYGDRSDDYSADMAEAKLTDYVDKNADRFIELWINNKTRKTQVLIENAIQKGLIKKQGTRFLYGKDVIGNSLHSAISWIDDLENQDIKLTILEALK